LRYLEGTPKESTRWIDTGWAIAAWQLGKGHVHDPIAVNDGVLRVRRNGGVVLDASFRVEPLGDRLTIVYESRGGARGSEDQRNKDYAEGLELVLRRLQAAGIRLADVLVESRETEKLPTAQRRVLPAGAEYPMAIEDPAALRKKLSAAQAKVGRRPGAKGGGNQTRRLRLVLEVVGMGRDEVAGWIERGRPAQNRPVPSAYR
jgi:hypothetical protein